MNHEAVVRTIMKATLNVMADQFEKETQYSGEEVAAILKGTADEVG